MPVHYLTRFGKYLGSALPGYSRNGQFRLAQFELYHNIEKRLELVKAIVTAKIHNQRSLLYRHGQKDNPLKLRKSQVNLAREIECLGDSLKTQLETRIQKLIEYVLIIRYCPESNQVNYYKSKAISQQYLIKRILKRNPSLNEFIEREYPEIFDTAIAVSRYLFKVPEDSFIESIP